MKDVGSVDYEIHRVEGLTRGISADCIAIEEPLEIIVRYYDDGRACGWRCWASASTCRRGDGFTRATATTRRASRDATRAARSRRETSARVGA